MSVALGWHPRHLATVLIGLTPPAPNDPIDDVGDSVPARLAAIEDQLHEITKHLAEMSANLSAMADRKAIP